MINPPPDQWIPSHILPPAIPPEVCQLCQQNLPIFFTKFANYLHIDNVKKNYFIRGGFQALTLHNVFKYNLTVMSNPTN